MTLLLYVLAMIFKEEGDNKHEQIWDTYIQNKYDDAEVKLKLKPIESDYEALRALIYQDSKQLQEGNRILENFKFFRDSIANYEEAKRIYKNLDALTIVEIALHENDDPQKIFQSLNSTGLELSQADLIRNYLLMNLPYDEQERLYRNYWSIIESNCTNLTTNDSRLSNFFRDYLSYKFNKTPSFARIFHNFQNRFTYEVGETHLLEHDLAQMKQFSGYYFQFINPEKTKDESLSRQLRALSRLEITVSYPFLLPIFHDYTEGRITHAEFLNLLQLIQTFTFRRFVCGLPTNALNKIFLTLYTNAEKIRDHYPEENLPYRVAVALMKYSSYQKFPDNEEFAESLRTRDMYNIQSKNRLYLLETLENQYHSWNETPVDLLTQDKMTIEHVFPQNPSVKWREDLAPGEYEEMERSVNTLANLTLVINNSSLGNKSFLEKRDLDKPNSKGFRHSKLNLNEYLSTINEWRPFQLKTRRDLLVQKCLEIWTYPVVDISGGNDIEVDLLDLDNPTYLKPDYIRLNGKKKSIKTNREIYLELLRYIHAQNPEILNTPVIKDKLIITQFKQIPRQPLMISQDLYCEGNLSNKALYDNMRELIEATEEEVILLVKFAE